MNIIEVKNNLVKLCYENDLKLAELIKINDNNKGYVAQIIHLEATRIGKTAIAKIIFNYNNGILAYDGSIPSLRAEIKKLNTDILLKIIDKENPLNLGKLAQENENLIVNIDILKDNPIICAEKYFTTKVLLNNIAMQLQARKSKIVVFDTAGIFKNNKITLTKDFKLPLNCSTINYIYEKGFEDATAESKALIQSIFEELGEYSRTVEYIPFDTFKAVIDAEFKRTQLMQLIILKNKIKQIRDWNVFAEKENDFKCLKTTIENNQTTVIDISCVKDELQKECIKYIYEILNDIKDELYIFTPLTNDNSDKQLLHLINENENIHTLTICGYDYRYLQELKQCSKNMLMFTPLKQQQDFGGYNIFLKKLAEDEFIAYGKMTKFVPLIAKLHALSQSEIYIPAETKPQAIPVTNSVETAITEKEEVISTSSEIIEKVGDEAAIITNNTNEIIPEQTTTETNLEITSEELPVTDDIQEISKEPEANAEGDMSLTEESIETIAETKTEKEIDNTEPQIVAPEEILKEENTNVEEALNQVPETEIDEELSDDDLDMIEKLSKPDEDIEVLNQNTENTLSTESNQTENESQQDIIDESEQVHTEETDTVETKEHTENPTPQPESIVEGTDEPIIESIAQEKIEETNIMNEETDISEEKESTNAEEAFEEKKNDNEQIEEISTNNSSVDDDINTATIPNENEPLQTRANKTPIVPEYSSEIPDEDKINNEIYKEGDRVMHQEFGEGVVEKMINYGDKILCSINFTSVGRRLLNPEITEMSKI